MRKVHGFTIVEMGIVIIIAIGLSFPIASMITVLNSGSTAQRLSKDVDLVLEAMNQFYHLNCNNPSAPTLTIAQLKADNLLRLNQFVNPLGSIPVINIDRSNPLNPIFTVTANFPDINTANFVAGYSEHANPINTTVTWSRNSTLSRSIDGVSRQLDREIFGSPLC